MKGKPELLKKGPPWLRKAHQEMVEYASAIKPVGGIGTMVYEVPGGIAINAQPGGQSAGTSLVYPWDEKEKTGIGEPDSEGNYDSYEFRFIPGNFGGIVPSNMFEAFTVPASGTLYFVVNATGSAGAIQSCSLEVSGSHPAGQVETLNHPPSTVSYVVGAFVDGVYFNVAQKLLSVTPKETFRESDPAATPYGLPYQSYFVWLIV